MAGRRQFLRFSALTATAAGLAACGTTDHPTAIGGQPLTCADPTPGTVTNPTGQVAGRTTTDLTDAFRQHDPDPPGTIEYQWQDWVGLSNVAGAGARYRLNQYKAGETQLFLILLGGHVGDPADARPVAHPTGSFPVGQDVYVEGSAGVTPNTWYQANVNFFTYDSRCRQTATGTAGWSGTITYTRADEQALEGSYDLTRGTDHLTGTFAAPRIPWAGCPARPSKATCV